MVPVCLHVKGRKMLSASGYAKASRAYGVWFSIDFFGFDLGARAMGAKFPWLR